jgi:Calcineurin-like phosphoesterase
MTKQFFHELEIPTTFSGALVLGDVHGMLDAFNRAMLYATNENLYVISLGDLVDYGPHSKEVIVKSKEVVDQNKMSIILGNHELKAFKYFTQLREGNVRIKVKSSLQATINSFANDTKIIDDFLNLHSKMHNVMKFKNNYFAHGALDPSVIEKKDYTPLGYQMALFGEVDKAKPMREDGFPNRIYSWIDKLPENIKVWVGHDIRSKSAPLFDKNTIWMDTGSGKEGVLHGAILDLNGELKEFKNFG